MSKNIVICSDGTGNTFDRSVSNVARLIKMLALYDRNTQVVLYDQGIGTNAKRLASVRKHRESISDKESLIILDGPMERSFYPAAWLVRLMGLIGGYGLEANVREMYDVLRRVYDGAEDNIYLVGFSRGAFTVRALAGLIYRCGLPRKDCTNFEVCFARAWQLYKPHHEAEAEVARFRNEYGQQHCSIHFLGLWDTVKSYGGLIPVSLPHLRHNPGIRIIRHALALNERRSWFNATTWGQLDLDEMGARRRLKEQDLRALEKQDVEEVWFRGCHSDIGGGDAEEVTARIALRWMLGEAADAGIRLSDEGMCLLKTDDPPEPPEVHESLTWKWWPFEFLPRKEINNSGVWPVKKLAWGRTGRRNPDQLRRKKHVFLHTSVGDNHSIPDPIQRQHTKGLN